MRRPNRALGDRPMDPTHRTFLLALGAAASVGYAAHRASQRGYFAAPGPSRISMTA